MVFGVLGLQEVLVVIYPRVRTQVPYHCIKVKHYFHKVLKWYCHNVQSANFI